MILVHCCSIDYRLVLDHVCGHSVSLHIILVYYTTLRLLLQILNYVSCLLLWPFDYVRDAGDKSKLVVVCSYSYVCTVASRWRKRRYLWWCQG